MGSYKSGLASPSKGYKYCYPTYSLLIATHEPQNKIYNFKVLVSTPENPSTAIPLASVDPLELPRPRRLLVLLLLRPLASAIR